MTLKQKIIISLAVFILLILPLPTASAPCENKQSPGSKTKGLFDVNCFVLLIANEIGFDTSEHENITTATLVDKISIFFALALAFLGVLFTCLAVYAGLLWMTAQGNEEQVKKAKNILRDAIFGLALILCSGMIMYVVTRILIIPNG